MDKKVKILDPLEHLLSAAGEFKKKGDLANAAKQYNRAAAESPLSFDVHYNMAEVQLGMGRVQDAQDCFTAAVCLDTENAESFWRFGNFFLRQNKLLLSIMCYLRAIKIDYGFHRAHMNLSALLDQILDRRIWAKAYEKMLAQDPDVIKAGPLRIRIETSSACNLRCQHCPTGTDYEGTDRQIMTMETFDIIVSQMQAFKIASDAIFYLGGEPLLNKNLALMCRRIKKETRVKRTLFNTNAMLVDKAICKDLALAGVDQISVSIDGRSPEENDQVRKGSDYATVLRNTKMLKSYLPDTKISVANTLIKRDGDPEKPVVSDFLERDFKGFPISCTYAMAWPGLDVKKSEIKNFGLMRDSIHGFCKHPFTEMVVRPNGDIVACCYDILGEQVMGSIHEKSLLEIWEGESYTLFRKAMLTRDVSQLPGICKKCLHFTGLRPVQGN